MGNANSLGAGTNAVTVNSGILAGNAAAATTYANPIVLAGGALGSSNANRDLYAAASPWPPAPPRRSWPSIPRP